MKILKFILLFAALVGAICLFTYAVTVNAQPQLGDNGTTFGQALPIDDCENAVTLTANVSELSDACGGTLQYTVNDIGEGGCSFESEIFTIADADDLDAEVDDGTFLGTVGQVCMCLDDCNLDIEICQIFTTNDSTYTVCDTIPVLCDEGSEIVLGECVEGAQEQIITVTELVDGQCVVTVNEPNVLPCSPDPCETTCIKLWGADNNTENNGSENPMIAMGDDPTRAIFVNNTKAWCVSVTSPCTGETCEVGVTTAQVAFNGQTNFATSEEIMGFVGGEFSGNDYGLFNHYAKAFYVLSACDDGCDGDLVVTLNSIDDDDQIIFPFVAKTIEVCTSDAPKLTDLRTAIVCDETACSDSPLAIAQISLEDINVDGVAVGTTAFTKNDGSAVAVGEPTIIEICTAENPTTPIYTNTGVFGTAYSDTYVTADNTNSGSISINKKQLAIDNGLTGADADDFIVKTFVECLGVQSVNADNFAEICEVEHGVFDNNMFLIASDDGTTTTFQPTPDDPINGAIGSIISSGNTMYFCSTGNATCPNGFCIPRGLNTLDDYVLTSITTECGTTAVNIPVNNTSVPTLLINTIIDAVSMSGETDIEGTIINLPADGEYTNCVNHYQGYSHMIYGCEACKVTGFTLSSISQNNEQVYTVENDDKNPNNY